MLSREDQELLVRVGPGTPMGEMMRRYWVPALLSEEIPEPDCDPVRVKLLGEELVAFRDTNGRVGLVEERCPHRLASLVFGRNEECGIRCLYHGWKFDVDGNCTDMWSEPDKEGFMQKVKLRAYPTVEIGDMIWAYMGPPDKRPPFPRFDWLTMPASQRAIAKMVEECNYLQALEGALDSSHSSSLHQGTLIDYRPSKDKAPRLYCEDTDYGFRYAAVRIPDRDPDKFRYVRVANYVMPFVMMIVRPMLPQDPAFAQIFVPRDDVTTTFYWVEFSQDGRPVTKERLRQKLYAVVGRDLDSDYRKYRTVANQFWQDRAAMRNGWSFTGIDGVPNQDMAMQESAGPIVDRTKEHLGKSDIAIIHLRRRLLESVRRFQNGETPIGIGEHIPYERIRSEQKLIPVDVPWQTVGAFAGEYQAGQREGHPVQP